MSAFWSIAASDVGRSASAGGKAAGAKALENRLGSTLLACEAMWSIMRDKLGVTDLELVERINEIDLSDGKLDGKVRKTVVACPKCNRTISPRFPKCMYCGQAIVHDPFA
ncbi:MAG: hypothetical protein ACE5HE_11815 [Phycisphaerae bacterium]